MAKKGENIYKRKDNRWEGRYIKGYATNGSAKYGYCYAESYRAVKEKLERAKTDLALGREKEKKAANRISGVGDEWLTVSRHKVKESTYVKYYTILNKHIKPGLGSIYVRDVDDLVIEKFTDELLNVKGLAPKTVCDILTVLHSVLKYAERKFGVTKRVEIVYPKNPKKEMRVLSIDEQKRLISFLKKDMDYYKFGTLLALITGMRIGEVCALRWRDVSLEERYIKVSSTMQRLSYVEEFYQQKSHIVISAPKSDSSLRIIPLTDFAIKLCKQFEVDDADAFVLTGRRDVICEPGKLKYHIGRYAKLCHLEKFHFHSLRHTFATRCVEVGFEIKTLSEILGHASPKITLERYVHTSMEMKRSNMSRLENIGF